jgi:hypothetical protein
MNRRSFTQTVGGAAALSALAGAQTAAPSRKTKIYRLDYYYLRQGSQGARLNEFLSSQMPLLTKSATAVGVFTAVIGPHVPATLALAGFASVAEMEAVDDRMRTVLTKMDLGSEALFESLERVLLRPTEFSPEIAVPAEKPKKARIWELRVYHAPTERQLGFLHDRFAGPEIKIFHKCGIFPVMYADTVAGPDMPNMTYLMPFEDLAAREKAWDAFGADPDWLKAREQSIARGGQIVAQSTISLLKPAAFSPMQ